MREFEGVTNKMFETEVRRQEFFGHSRENAMVAAISVLRGGISGCSEFDATWQEAVRRLKQEKGID